MNKGLYFMGWPREMWNYHPSLPMKNLHMIEDIEEMHGNLLLWSCMGSGAIGLPYLEREIADEVAPRMRFYGYLNDREFCEECQKRGIRPFAVLWKAQLWEFPVKWNEDGTEIMALNILRETGGVEKTGWIGMRELSKDCYSHIFASINKFFPDGLYNFKGEKVTDFLEEFHAVSLEGKNILARWLMAPGHEHKCYSACANKSSYLKYLQKEIEMMIDAGAGGIHIDEYDSQKHVLNNAGCFCTECVHKFNTYLKNNKVELPEDVESYEKFDYRVYLLQKGYTDRDLLVGNGNHRWEIPLFREYIRMQMDSIEYVVRKLSEYARKYAKYKMKNIQISANLFNCYPHSWNCKKYLDVLSGEKTDIGLRQDGWYHFAAGWLNGKEGCFVEDPNQYVRDMAVDAQKGINDRMILFLMEPLAHGFHMAFPYGSWLQNQVKDALWPDLRMLKKLGVWLDEYESAFSRNPQTTIAVIYDWKSASENQWNAPPENWNGVLARGELPEELGAEGAFEGDGTFKCFFNFLQKLSDRKILYRVIYESPDEPLTAARLIPFGHVILPDAFAMREEDQQILRNYQENGGKVITLGQEPLLPGNIFRAEMHIHESNMDELIEMLADVKQEISICDDRTFGIAWNDIGGGRALHIVNYNYNSNTHKISNISCLKFEMESEWEISLTGCFPENESFVASLDKKDLIVKNIGIYSVIELKKKE